MENKFESICNELVALQKAKNADYGDSFSQSVKEFGLTAALIPITNKVNRLKQLINSDSAEVKNESINDTLKDLACYAIMTLSEIEKPDTTMDVNLEIAKSRMKNLKEYFDREEVKVKCDNLKDEVIIEKQTDSICNIFSNIRRNLFISELSIDIDYLLKKYNIKF